MKIKCLLLAALLLAVSTVGFAQAKKTAVATPEKVVKDLYTAQKNEKTNPFDQASRVLIDKYFTKDLADLIWKTIRTENGWRHIDALYNSHEQLRDSQDPQITNFVVGAPKRNGGPNNVYVKVTFKNHGEVVWSGFVLQREANKTWKIASIEYSDGDNLTSILQYLTDLKYQTEVDSETFKGNYMVGATLCNVVPTMNRVYFRVTCDGQEGFKLSIGDGEGNDTVFSSKDGKNKVIDKFVFKENAEEGKFIDASGKEVKVKRVQ